LPHGPISAMRAPDLAYLGHEGKDTEYEGGQKTDV
jgi:hypothetical protein